MFKLESHFMGSFKLGDNIVYNLKVLKKLYKISTVDNTAKSLFRKIQIIIIVSIIEAVIYDLHKRAKYNVNEGVQNLPLSVLNYIRSKQIDKFEQLIASAQKHKIFDSFGNTFYDDLNTLRKLRNRVHIQNEKGDFEPDDKVTFSGARLVLAEQTLERVCRLMLLKHARNPRLAGVVEFEFPWTPYYP